VLAEEQRRCPGRDTGGAGRRRRNCSRVAEEVGRLLSVASVAMGRYESDGTMTTVATRAGWATASPLAVGGHLGGRTS